MKNAASETKIQFIKNLCNQNEQKIYVGYKDSNCNVMAELSNIN